VANIARGRIRGKWKSVDRWEGECGRGYAEASAARAWAVRRVSTDARYVVSFMMAVSIFLKACQREC
jgi:hypothetical protein